MVQVPPVLAKLLEGSEELQKAALDADVVKHLAALLSPPADADAAAAGASAGALGGGAAVRGGAALQEGVLRALGNLCLTRNDGRKQLIEAKVLPKEVWTISCVAMPS